jgi:hypothetical protein
MRDEWESTVIQVGPDRLCQWPLCVPKAAGFRRVPVQIKDLKNAICCHNGRGGHLEAHVGFEHPRPGHLGRKSILQKSIHQKSITRPGHGQRKSQRESQFFKSQFTKSQLRSLPEFSYHPLHFWADWPIHTVEYDSFI